MRYRKKPVIIEAVELREDNIYECTKFLQANLGLNYKKILEEAGSLLQLPFFWEKYVSLCKKNGGISINTLEGEIFASFGDFIIKGVKGEFYPCKPDIFKLTYEALPEEATK